MPHRHVIKQTEFGSFSLIIHPGRKPPFCQFQSTDLNKHFTQIIIIFWLMLRKRATETRFLARAGGAGCPAYGFFRYFALSFYMSESFLGLMDSSSSQFADSFTTFSHIGTDVDNFLFHLKVFHLLSPGGFVHINWIKSFKSVMVFLLMASNQSKVPIRPHFKACLTPNTSSVT